MTFFSLHPAHGDMRDFRADGETVEWRFNGLLRGEKRGEWRNGVVLSGLRAAVPLGVCAPRLRGVPTGVRSGVRPTRSDAAGLAVFFPFTLFGVSSGCFACFFFPLDEAVFSSFSR